MNIFTGNLISNSNIRETYFIALIYTGSHFPLAANSQEIWFSDVPLEITFKNKVPSGNIHARTFLLAVNS
jgi:hypothetical protein